MKSIIQKGGELEFNDVSKYKEVMESHNLHKLWNLFRQTIFARWPDGDQNVINFTEKIILAFHEIDDSGQKLRYSTDKKGNNTLSKLPKAVELTTMKSVFDKTFSLLDGCELDFNECINYRNEMISDSQS